MTTPDQVDLWRGSRSEDHNLEFKEAKNQFDFAKLCRYCVALANEGGGTLLLGVADKPPRAIVGSAAFPDTVKAAESLFNQIGFRVEVEAVAHPHGRVVVFHIPPRPRGTAYHLDGQYLMRSGEELVPMTEDRLRGIFAEGKPDWLAESVDAVFTPQDLVEHLDTQTYFQLLQLPYPSRQEGVIDRLRADRLVVEERGGLTLNRLGALLLARRLGDFPSLGRVAPRLIVYSGNDKMEPRLDQEFPVGYAVGFRTFP